MNFAEKIGIENHDFRLIIGRTKIDFDKDKEDINCKKHKYSLESAVTLFEHVLLLSNKKPFITSEGVVHGDGEIRHIHMSIDDCGDVVLFVTTMRDDETVRIISFRRANHDECKTFASNTGYSKNNKKV